MKRDACSSKTWCFRQWRHYWAWTSTYSWGHWRAIALWLSSNLPPSPSISSTSGPRWAAKISTSWLNFLQLCYYETYSSCKSHIPPSIMQDMETPFPTSLCLTRRAKKYLHKASKRGQINDEAAVEGYLSDLRKWSWVKNKRQSGAMYCSVPECYGKCIRGGGIAKDSVLSILFVTQNHTESTKIKSKVPGTSKRQRLAISDTEVSSNFVFTLFTVLYHNREKNLVTMIFTMHTLICWHVIKAVLSVITETPARKHQWSRRTTTAKLLWKL